MERCYQTQPHPHPQSHGRGALRLVDQLRSHMGKEASGGNKSFVKTVIITGNQAFL